MSTPGAAMNTRQCLRLLDDMRAAGVFSINFNGGEPLLRPDFFEIAHHAHALGFDLHLNTNATLINDALADALARYFPSICTSVLASTPERHDALVGRAGAFVRMRGGVDRLLARGIKIEVNVCTCTANYTDIYDIARVMAAEGVHVFCVTRYIMVQPTDAQHALDAAHTLAVLDALDRISHELPTYAEVKLPGPVPYCELPDAHREKLRRWNTPCQVGYGLCRISPQGLMTPCPLSDHIIGSVLERTFAALWQDPAWGHYARVEHLPANCRSCDELESCRGGCVLYDQCRIACGYTPKTWKWGDV